MTTIQILRMMTKRNMTTMMILITVKTQIDGVRGTVKMATEWMKTIDLTLWWKG